MTKLDVVCLCDLYDIKELLAEDMARDNPWMRLLDPSEVTDDTAIRHAIAFSPSPDLLARFRGLELISSVGAGVDGLLSNPGLSATVQVSRVIAKEQAQSMAAFALWFIVGWQREIATYDALQQQARWHGFNRVPPSQFPVGILGYGAIGKTLGQTLTGLGYPVFAYANTAREESGVTVLSGPDGLHEVAARSRAVVNLLPLTDETTGILSAPFFAAMQEGSILIQHGRGAHLVEDDLFAALDVNRPAMAALDVFATEPLPGTHPFWQHPKVFVTPHVAGEADYRTVAHYIAAGVQAFEAGERPEGWVDRNRGY